MTVENSSLSIISGSSGKYLTTKCGGVGNELMSDTFLPKVEVSFSDILLSHTFGSINFHIKIKTTPMYTTLPTTG
jgi:hypothetical protein